MLAKQETLPRLTDSPRFLVARDKGARFLLKLVSRVKELAATFQHHVEKASTYHKGEHVPGGHFLCAGCAHEVVLDVSRRIPSCSICGKDEFHRKM